MTAEIIEDVDPNRPYDPIQAHSEDWTEEEYLGISAEDGPRIELIDGGLVVSPVGDVEHQDLGFLLCVELHRQLPDKFRVFHEVNLRLEPGRLVIPDVAIATSPGKGKVVDAADIVLVGEVVSRSSRTKDRIWKPALYAEAGIEWYVRLEREPRLELVLHHLEDGAYAVVANAGTGETLELPGLDCTVDIDALTR